MRAQSRLPHHALAWVALGLAFLAAGTQQPAAQALEEQRLEDRRTMPSSTTTQKTSAPPVDSPKASSSEIQKLDQILANQEEILRRFDKVMEELGVIKIRASIH